MSPSADNVLEEGSEYFTKDLNNGLNPFVYFISSCAFSFPYYLVNFITFIVVEWSSQGHWQHSSKTRFQPLSGVLTLYVKQWGQGCGEFRRKRMAHREGSGELWGDWGWNAKGRKGQGGGRKCVLIVPMGPEGPAWPDRRGFPIPEPQAPCWTH